MFPRYFPGKFFAPRYWVKTSLGATLGGGCGCSTYGDGSLYGDGETYCTSEFVRKSYIVVRDALCHYLSIRVQATGHFVLDSIRALVTRYAPQPFNYWVQADIHNVKRMSLRITGSGCMRVNSIRPVVNVKNQQPAQ